MCRCWLAFEKRFLPHSRAGDRNRRSRSRWLYALRFAHPRSRVHMPRRHRGVSQPSSNSADGIGVRRALSPSQARSNHADSRWVPGFRDTAPGEPAGGGISGTSRSISSLRSIRMWVVPSRQRVLRRMCESTIWAFFESIVGKRRPSHILNQALQASAIACGYADGGVEAHAPVGRDAGRGLGVCAHFVGIDMVPEAPPALAKMTARCNARAQRCRGEVREEWIVSGERVVVAVCAGFEKPDGFGGRCRREPAPLRRRWAGAKGGSAGSLLGSGDVSVYAVECQGMEMHVQIQGGSKTSG